MSILPKSAARDVCECSRNPTERDAHSRYPIVRAADAYPRTEAAWSVSACSMNQAVQDGHTWYKNETARDTCVSSRNETGRWAPKMKPPNISACVPEWNRQRYLDVWQNETARDICVYEWNWRIYLHVSQNETARDICVYSRKEPDGHTCACSLNETARHSSRIGNGRGICACSSKQNWKKKKLQLCNLAARLADTVQFTNYHITPSSTSTFRGYLQFSLIQLDVRRGCPTIVNSVATSKHAPVTRIMLKAYMMFTRPVIRTAYHADEKTGKLDEIYYRKMRNTGKW